MRARIDGRSRLPRAAGLRHDDRVVVDVGDVVDDELRHPRAPTRPTSASGYSGAASSRPRGRAEEVDRARRGEQCLGVAGGPVELDARSPRRRRRSPSCAAPARRRRGRSATYASIAAFQYGPERRMPPPEVRRSRRGSGNVIDEPLERGAEQHRRAARRARCPRGCGTGRPPSMSASPATRSGCRSAKRTETNAPIEWPSDEHARRRRARRGPRARSSACSREPVRRGQAVAAAAAAQVGSDDARVGKRGGDEVPVAVGRGDAVHGEHREARGIRSPLAARQRRRRRPARRRSSSLIARSIRRPSCSSRPVTMPASAPASQQREARDLGGLDEPLDRGLGEHDLRHHLVLGDAVQARLVGDLLLDERRAHVAGVDAVRGDAVRAALERGDLREALEAVLGRRRTPTCTARRAGRARSRR